MVDWSATYFTIFVQNHGKVSLFWVPLGALGRVSGPRAPRYSWHPCPRPHQRRSLCVRLRCETAMTGLGILPDGHYQGVAVGTHTWPLVLIGSLDHLDHELPTNSQKYEKRRPILTSQIRIRTIRSRKLHFFWTPRRAMKHGWTIGPSHYVGIILVMAWPFDLAIWDHLRSAEISWDQHLASASKLACLEIWSQNTAPRSCELSLLERDNETQTPWNILYLESHNADGVAIGNWMVDVSGLWGSAGWSHTDHANERLTHLLT